MSGVLKPCPFCGEENEDQLYWEYKQRGGVTQCYVGCDTCSTYHISVADKATAIAAWNRRHREHTTTIIATGDTVTLAEAEDGEILPAGDYVVAEVMRNGEAFTVVDHPRVLVHLKRVNAVARRDD